MYGQMDDEAVLRATRLDLRATVREFLATVWDPDVINATLAISAVRPDGVVFQLEVRQHVMSNAMYHGVMYVIIDDPVSSVWRTFQYTDDKAYTDDVLNGCEDWIVQGVARVVRRKAPPHQDLYKGSEALSCVQRTMAYKEELMARTWHPSRMVDWCLDTEEARALFTST